MLKNKMFKYKVMEFHKQLVKSGKYMEAKSILTLLRDGHIRLSLSDVDCYLESQLEKLGGKIVYSGRRYTAHAYLKAE